MRSLPGLYAQQFKTSLAVMLQYRASLLIWLISHLLEPLVYLAVWSAVSAARGGSVGGYDAHEFAAYFICLMLVNHVTYTWIMWEYEYRVRHGSLSFALLRPVHPIHADLADNLSSKIITLPLILAAAAVLAILFRPSFHAPAWAAAAFVPSVLLALALRFLMEWTLALAAFWTTRVGALNRVYFVALLFLSGQMAPLSLLPAPIRTAATFLPFRWTTSFPVELLMGKLAPADALVGLAAQAAWVLACAVALRVVWRAGVRVFTAVGA
ncbi:MAG TPA: ABC-2 family transporter protein [Spirochaetia bacterium]|nr:ABC-2 family transporter protein [Spirochaetia bacterium]